MPNMAKKLKNVSLLDISGSYRRILAHFFSYPERTTGLNDLSKQIGSSKTSTKLAVNHLIKQGFLKKEEVGNAWRLCVEPRNSFIMTKKIILSLSMTRLQPRRLQLKRLLNLFPTTIYILF